MGKGHIFLFDCLTLQNVLYVPKISYNLLSIRDLHCQAIFSLDTVSFQDLSLGKMIGTAQHDSSLSSYFSTLEERSYVVALSSWQPKFSTYEIYVSSFIF